MFSFIILHYKNIKDTIECIKSINKLNYEKHKIKIIVVDNNSLTENDEKKLKKYNIDLLKMNENLGFAKANNKGCEFAIKKYRPDFLCVINNDIIIEQNNFLKKIKELYDKHKFDVLGPKINTNNGDSVNPFQALESSEEIEKEINYCKKAIKIYNNLFLFQFFKIYHFFKYNILKFKTEYKNAENQKIDVALHGCSLIFSKKYYEKFTNIFYDQTFLYHEEEFLNYRRKKNNLLFLYDPSIEVYHKEGQSLNSSLKSSRKKSLFKFKEKMTSLNLLKEIIEKDISI